MKSTLRFAAVLLATTTFCVSAMAAGQLTIMASGGAWQEAQRHAWFEPFAHDKGVQVTEQEYLGDLGKIRAMVETGNVPIDLVTVETATVLQGCDSGILEHLDYSKIADRSKFLPGTAL